MPNLNRITRVSAWLYWASAVLAHVLPSIVIFAILQGWFDPASLLARFPLLASGTVVRPFQGTAVALIAVLSVFPLIAALMAMQSLFLRYRRGEILTDGRATDILRIGRAMFLVAATTVLVPMLQHVALRWNAGQGKRVLQIGLDGNTLGFLLSGSLLFVIGWVMGEAARVKVENQGFV